MIGLGFMLPDYRLASFKDGLSVGNLPFTVTPEISGLARSQKAANSGYLWTIDDNRVNPVKLCAVAKANGASGGTITLTGAVGVDVEDISSATIGGTFYLYVSDTGDNASTRTSVNVFRFAEPTITGSDQSVGTFETIVCQYPASPTGELGTTPRDVESMFVDPDTGDMYFITKRNPTVQVHRLAHQTSYSGTQTLTYLGDMFALPTSVPANGNNGGRATGADISPDGSEIVVKNYTTMFYFRRRKPSQSIYQALAATPVTITGYVGGGRPSSHPNNEPQGEAVCFDNNGLNLYTASEAVAAFGSTASFYPLFRYDRIPRPVSSMSFQQGVSSYTGTSDTYLYSLAGSNTQVRGAETTFIAADNDLVTPNARYGLLKFDLSTFPAKKRIVGCELQLHINTEGQTIFVHQMLTAWASATTTYSNLYTPNRMPRFDGIDASAAEITHFGNYDTLVTGVSSVDYIKLRLPASLIQAWVDGTVANNGLLFYNTDGDGMQFRSAEHATTADHPKLTIYYV